MTEITDAERAKMRDLRAMVAGIGAHTGHTRRQIGRCVHGSCGARAQARLPDGPANGDLRARWDVVLPDGFVCYQGTDPERASQVAARHDGAVVRQARR